MQRLLPTGSLKAGFSASVLARALTILFPILSSFAQEGTKPHRNPSRFPLLPL